MGRGMNRKDNEMDWKNVNLDELNWEEVKIEDTIDLLFSEQHAINECVKLMSLVMDIALYRCEHNDGKIDWIDEYHNNLMTLNEDYTDFMKEHVMAGELLETEPLHTMYKEVSDFYYNLRAKLVTLILEHKEITQKRYDACVAEHCG
jgi:hypothetical protein